LAETNGPEIHWRSPVHGFFQAKPNGLASWFLGVFCLSGCFSGTQAEAIAQAADHKLLRLAETCG